MVSYNVFRTLRIYLNKGVCIENDDLNDSLVIIYWYLEFYLYFFSQDTVN